MITLLEILTKLLFHPLKYGLLSFTMTDGLTVFAFGKKKEVKSFEQLVRDTHTRHLKKEFADAKSIPAKRMLAE